MYIFGSKISPKHLNQKQGKYQCINKCSTEYIWLDLTSIYFYTLPSIGSFTYILVIVLIILYSAKITLNGWHGRGGRIYLVLVD